MKYGEVENKLDHHKHAQLGFLRHLTHQAETIKHWKKETLCNNKNTNTSFYATDYHNHQPIIFCALIPNANSKNISIY